MRIVGGARRGLRLAELGPGDPAAQLRPTADRVREAVFNLLQHAPGRPDPVPGARVLDLFAGTGAMGLEALSRGARQAVFVESGAAALRLLRENIARMRAGAAARVLAGDATRLPPCPGAPMTLVFLDPPWGRGLGAAALAAARAGGWIAPGATVAWEEAAPQPAPEGFTELDRRRYGAAWITLFAAPG
jgi:16S rRNA (guanine966-N2)-methyltransferase